MLEESSGGGGAIRSRRGVELRAGCDREVCNPSSRPANHTNISDWDWAKFSSLKKGGHRGKISVVDMVFLVFIGFCIDHRRGKIFLWARKVPNDFLSVVVMYVFFFFSVGKSYPWTNASLSRNFRRTFRAIGPYEFP